MASFLELLTKNQPNVETRQALLVLGLQNDFVAGDGKLAVSDTAFLPKIEGLVAKFREEAGDIIWIRAVFEGDRVVNKPTGTGDNVCIGPPREQAESVSDESVAEETVAPKEAPLPSPTSASAASPKHSSRHTKRAMDMFKKMSKRKNSSSQVPSPAQSPSPAAQAHAQAAVPPSPSPTPRVAEEAVDEELFLAQNSRSGPCCRPGTRGVEFPESVGKQVDRGTDLIVQTTHYSAFNATSLLLMLRSKLVTELYVCGCLTNINVYATALDAARHGFQINLVEDCLGHRSEVRHLEALRQMTELMGAQVVSSAELLSALADGPENGVAAAEGGKSRKVTEGREEEGNKLEELVSKLKLDDRGSGRRKGHGSPPSDVKDMARPQKSKSATFDLEADSAEETPKDRLKKMRSRGFERKQQQQQQQQQQQESAEQSPARRETRTKVRMRRKDGGRREKERPIEKNVAKDGDAAEQAAAEKVADDEKGAQVAESSPPEQEDMLRPPKVIERKHRSLDVYKRREESEPESPLKTVQSQASLLKGIQRMTLGGPNQGPPAESAGGARHPAVAVQVKPGKMPSLATFPALGPGDKIAEGDSQIVYGLFPDNVCWPRGTDIPVSELLMGRLYSEVRWQKMHHAQGEVPRLVCVQGEFSEDGSMPVYRHPSDTSLPLLHLTPAVTLIREMAEKIVKHPLNHVLIQLYRGGADYISEHSDKTLDVVRGSSIVNVSYGAQRTMRLRTKKSASSAAGANDGEGEAASERTTQRVPLPHNSMFILGPRSNEKWLHSIQPDKRPVGQLSEAETAYHGMRISLTFRHVGTFIDARSERIWGQGAASKKRAGAKRIVNGDAAATESLIRAFGAENKATDFDWEAAYGAGSNVLHARGPHAELPMFFPNNRPHENRMAAIMLAELDLPHLVCTAPPPHPAGVAAWEHERLISFRDVDVRHTEVPGGIIPLLLYLDHTHPLPPPSGGANLRATATTYECLFICSTFAADLQRHIDAKRAPSTHGPLPGPPKPTFLNPVPGADQPCFFMSLVLLEFKVLLNDEEYGPRDRPSPPSPAPAPAADHECPPRAHDAGPAAPSGPPTLARTPAFAAGPHFTLADCAAWPLVDLARREWDGWRAQDWPNLESYWARVGGRASVRRVLEAERRAEREVEVEGTGK